MGVALELYAGEDWVQQLGFYTDPVADPQTLDHPMILVHPYMAIRPQRNTQQLAALDSTGLLDGTLVLGDPGQLTIRLPHAVTSKLNSLGTVRFDIFDDIAGRRIAILKSGTILVTDSVSNMP